MIKLNLGAGEDIKKEWINVDIYEFPNIDVIHDLNKKPYPFEDHSIDEINASYVLEHIRNLGVFVDECYRILKPGRKITIKCDYAGYIFLFILKRMEHNSILENNYSNTKFHKKALEDCHYCLFVPSHLNKLFRKFKHKEITFPSPKRKRWKNVLLNLLPYNLGKQHIQLEGVK